MDLITHCGEAGGRVAAVDFIFRPVADRLRGFVVDWGGFWRLAAIEAPETELSSLETQHRPCEARQMSPKEWRLQLPMRLRDTNMHANEKEDLVDIRRRQLQ